MTQTMRIADPEIARDGDADRAETHVAVGVLIRPDGAFLLTSRPQGKAYAGYWEFPGGKVEPGESTRQALRRELREELGIEVTAASAWKVEVVDYPHALVRLHFFKVTAWNGDLEMREQQASQWETIPVTVAPILPGTIPVLEWLASESNFQFSDLVCVDPTSRYLGEGTFMIEDAARQTES
jgi:8-oxo-dGTP diphosphatase